MFLVNMITKNSECITHQSITFRELLYTLFSNKIVKMGCLWLSASYVAVIQGSCTWDIILGVYI